MNLVVSPFLDVLSHSIASHGFVQFWWESNRLEYSITVCMFHRLLKCFPYIPRTSNEHMFLYQLSVSTEAFFMLLFSFFQMFRKL